MHDRMPQWISKWSTSALCLQAASSTYELVWKNTTMQSDSFWVLQGAASSMYPPESLGDFTQTLFLQGKTSQSTFRCKLALFLYCLLDRQSGAGGHKLKLESFRCTALFMCVFCQSVVCLVFRPQHTTLQTYTTSSTEGYQLRKLYYDHMQSSQSMSMAKSPAHILTPHCTDICTLCQYLSSPDHCVVVCL